MAKQAVDCRNMVRVKVLHTHTTLWLLKNKKASIRWQDSAPPISGYWPTSEPNAGLWRNDVTAAALWGEVCNAGASNAGRSLCVHISRERSYPLPIYWYHSKGNWLRYHIAL